MRQVVLSDRMRAVASMVTAGNRVCDVGCDHGFVSIYLVEQRLSPAVLAMDVRSGPLGAAREHIAERGLEESITTRMSDGLHNYNIGEADTLICAGMGGGLMRRILSENSAKTDSFQELVLQPQSEIEQFRAWLREQGYRITEEKMVAEDGKFYPMMRVDVGACRPHIKGSDLCKLKSGDECVQTECEAENDDQHQESERVVYEDIYGNLYGAAIIDWRGHIINNTRIEIDDRTLCKLENRYGAMLLKRRDRVLESYLQREERIYEEILTGLRTQGLEDEKRQERYMEISGLLEECRVAHRIVEA